MSWAEQLYNRVSICKSILFFCLPNGILNFWDLQTAVFFSAYQWMRTFVYWYEANLLFFDTFPKFLRQRLRTEKSAEYTLKILPNVYFEPKVYSSQIKWQLNLEKTKVDQSKIESSYTLINLLSKFLRCSFILCRVSLNLSTVK